MKLSTTHSVHGIKNQQGIVLVVALLILVVMTILGVSMLSSSTLEERMAGNIQAKNVTFQAAESCIRQALQPSNAGLRATTTETKQILSAGNNTLACNLNGVPATVNLYVPTLSSNQDGNMVAFDLGVDKQVATGYVLVMQSTSTLASGTSTSATFTAFVPGAAGNGGG